MIIENNQYNINSKWRWGPIVMHFMGVIKAYTKQSKVHAWDILGRWANTSCSIEYWWYTLGLSQIKVVACKTS